MIQDNSPQLLVSRARGGSIEALNTLLDAYKQQIYAVAYALLNDTDDALKAMRESLIAVWKNIGLLEDGENFENWLYHITYVISEQILDERGKTPGDRTDKLVSRVTASKDLMLPQRYAAQDELRERLSGILAALPDRWRETLSLYHYHNKSVEDIAAITECSERKVQSRLYLANHAVKDAIVEQEKQNGEQFFGVEPGAVPLGSFAVRYIERGLPSQETVAQLLDSSRRDAYFTNNTYTAKLSNKPKGKTKRSRAAAPRHLNAVQSARSNDAPAVPKAQSVPSTPAPKPNRDTSPQHEAPRDYSLAIKIFVAAILISLLACLGLLAYNTFFSHDGGSAQPSETAHMATQAVQATQAAVTEVPAEATKAPTEAPTETPTSAPASTAAQADHSGAYSAYKGVLEEYRESIQDYTWQYRVDPAHPIAFADVMGDDTPEMIYAYSNDIGDGGDRYLTLRVITFDGKNAVEAYKYDLTDNTRRSGGIYCVTQLDGEKSLYTFAVTSPGQLRTETAYRYVDDGDNKLRQEEAVVYNPRSDIEDEERVDGKEVSADEAEDAYYSLAARTSLLLLSSSDSRGVSYPSILNIEADNAAMTYDEAMRFLEDNMNQ